MYSIKIGPSRSDRLLTCPGLERQAASDESGRVLSEGESIVCILSYETVSQQDDHPARYVGTGPQYEEALSLKDVRLKLGKDPVTTS